MQSLKLTGKALHLPQLKGIAVLEFFVKRIGKFSRQGGQLYAQQRQHCVPLRAVSIAREHVVDSQDGIGALTAGGKEPNFLTPDRP